MSVEISLKGKVAIVTGAAGGGSGLEAARLLAQAGAKVVLADLPGTKLADAAATVSGEKAFHEVDIADEASIEALIAFTMSTFGRIDILDNNAARTGPGDADVVSMSLEVWDVAMNVNARGTMLMCKHAIPHMINGGGGSIINISSGTAEAGEVYATAYACSKGAINTLTRYIATQYGAQGVRCNTIAPGLLLTPASSAAMPVQLQEAMVRAGKLIKRLGRPSDIAQAVLFLASDHASWITGQLLPVDGGFYAHQPTMDAIGSLMSQLMRKA
jgi:NAD(P)-dependent dehydrogenase (short-subunit alcohol dehydrogenase family)